MNRCSVFSAKRRLAQLREENNDVSNHLPRTKIVGSKDYQIFTVKFRIFIGNVDDILRMCRNVT